MRYGFLAGILSIGFMVLLYLIDKTWMVKFSKLFSYGLLFISMYKGVSQIVKPNFSIAFRESWVIFVVGSTLFHLALFFMMNYVDDSLYAITQQIASSFLASEDVQEALPEIKVSKLREITFPLVLSFIFPGAVMAGIIAVIKNKDSIID